MIGGMLAAERDLIPLLGKPISHVAELPGLPTDRDEYVGESSITWSYRSAGLELSFGREDGRLETIFFHAPGHEGFIGFTSPLPLGLDFLADPDDVNGLLGQPSASGGGQASKVFSRRVVPPWSVYRLPTYVLHVQYSPDRDRVVLVTIRRPDIAPPVGDTH